MTDQPGRVPSATLSAEARQTCCRHGFGGSDPFDACCICGEYPLDAPCEVVSAAHAATHGRLWRKVDDAWRQEAVEFALEHGHAQTDPWGECPASCKVSAPARTPS